MSLNKEWRDRLNGSFRSELRSEFQSKLDMAGFLFPSENCLKIDLHCHDKNSDTPDELWGRILRLPETWLNPQDLLKSLYNNGVSAATITNHNNATSCWKLLDKGHDVLVGAEWTCAFPEYDLWIHILVYGFTPMQEKELEKRRRNVYDFLRYCREWELPVIQPHPLYYYVKDKQPNLEFFEKCALLFERYEVCNGQRETWQNLLTWKWVESLSEEKITEYSKKHNLDPYDFCSNPMKKAVTGGSDDHFGVLSGLTGSLLYVKDLNNKLVSGEPVSRLALEAIKNKDMMPYGSPSDEEKLSVALMDYTAQAALYHEDPGLMRMMLHKGTWQDKLYCIGISNMLAELRRHKYTTKFLKTWHLCLQGEKPGALMKLAINKDYRPLIGVLEDIANAKKKNPETLPQVINDSLRRLGDFTSELVASRMESGIKPILQNWSQESSKLSNPSNSQIGSTSQLEDWIEHLEISSHFRALFEGKSSKKAKKAKKKFKIKKSEATIGKLLDDVSFPSLMLIMQSALTLTSVRTLFASREVINNLAESIDGPQYPKKALWLTDTFTDSNGVASVLQSMRNYFEENQTPIDILCCGDEEAIQPHLHQVKSLAKISLPGFEEQEFRFPNLLEVLRGAIEGGYDRIICSTEGPMAWVALFLKYALDVPAHFFMHTDWLEYLVRNTNLDQKGMDRARRFLRWFYNRWDGVFVLNDTDRNWLTSESMGIEADKVHKTSHWVHKEFYPRNLALDFFSPIIGEKDKVLLYAGRLSEEKGVFDVVQIYKELKVKHKNLKLVFAGRGPADKALVEAIPEAHFTGWISREELAQWYSRADFMLFPSRFDTFGCAVLEALSCACPVACYNVKGPGEIVSDRISGVVGDCIEDLISKLDGIFGDPKILASLRKGALFRATDFDADIIMSEFLENLGLPQKGLNIKDEVHQQNSKDLEKSKSRAKTRKTVKVEQDQ